ncbi:MAG: hypothetical protein H3C49_01150 [Alphaproteobacteria bacterium]|nr:hypothetical protein [Alphaproteobacteria bacterium]HRI76742.1 hypothetical protein [Alphaproteobacteria bacterium]
MTNDKNKPVNKKAAARAEALRANLMKRKQQTRARAEQPDTAQNQTNEKED